MQIEQTYSLILALATAAVAGIVGSFALMKKISLAGDVMSHIALPGLAIAMIFKINPLLGGGLALLLGSVLIWQLQEKSSLSADTAIGVIFVAALALGALLLNTEEELIDALFGGFGSINLIGFILGMVGVIVVGLTTYLLKDKLILSLFSPELAATFKINVRVLNLIYLLIFSLTILIGLQFLGAVLVGAIIIVPAAIGRQLTHTLGKFMLCSAISGALSVAIGFGASNLYHLSLGPTIVIVSAVLFGLSLFKKKD